MKDSTEVELVVATHYNNNNVKEETEAIYLLS